MSDQTPAPRFDSENYARPNQNWTCGHACEGKACPRGPDSKGRCGAEPECKPVLETKPNEKKGRWRCNRAKGECESGPLPDGTCCRPIPKCVPVPTLRLWRKRVTLAVVAFSCAVLLIVLASPRSGNIFISPGELSVSHTGEQFAALAVTNRVAPGCAACHAAGNSGPNGMVSAALRADPGILDLKKLAAAHADTTTVIDESCLKCHIGHDIHQPDAKKMSCSFCHQEHQGKMMAATTDLNCTFCHGDVAKMAVAARADRPAPPLVRHFGDDQPGKPGHPEFRFKTEGLKDPDTLRFNHKLHLTSPTVQKLADGGKLECNYCHQVDSEGVYMKPVAFEQNCRKCHSLQFDPATPELKLPHGNADFVTAFLHSLPKQYEELGARLGVRDVRSFAINKQSQLYTNLNLMYGPDLEHRVFFNNITYGPEAKVGALDAETRAVYAGCTYCHEVKPGTNSVADITKPVQTAPWLTMAKFNHVKHANISCEQCHDTTVRSELTSDILVPVMSSCTTCHNPKSGVADTCAECHNYHTKPMMAAR
jgi:hypothetical protein